ncbi:MAG: hypothetical protein HUJ11_00800, partial [Arenibacter algicola]|nr:hypothetical protein [Arenibacter algicola]
MKNNHVFFCRVLGMAVKAQIKIGDNPQNIDPSSVLELESSSRVLVITRVNTAQMGAIVPSAGALVYNTDVECIHYYTGTEWKDICDAVAGSITFTSDDGTIVITSTGGNNYDLKVGEITGMNIVNETVFGADIATATIGERQLAPNSVGSSELQDNTVGKDEIQEAAVGTLEIIDGTIKPEDMEPGAFDQLLTTDAAGNVVWLNKNELGATQADQSTITGAGTLADPIKVGSTVLGDILANATAITTKEDVANKSDDTALGNSTTLYPTQNAVKTYVDQLAGAASTLADGNIFVGSAGNVATGVPMGGDATIDNSGLVTIADLAITSPKIALNAVGQPHLADNAVISNKILNGNVTPIKIQPGAANQIMTTNTLGVVTWQPIAAVGGNQDLASVLGFGTSAGNNQINNLANPTAPQDAATQAYVDAQVGGSAQTIVSEDTPNSITTGTDGGALYNDGDDDDSNELQTISLTGNNLILSDGGGSVPLPSGADGVVTGISATGNNLVVTGSGGGFNGNVNLEPLVDNAVSNNGFLTTEVDGDVTNEIITASSLSGTTLTITEGGNDFDIDLSGLGGVGTDNQQLTLAGNTLTLEDGGTPISLVPYLDDTDDQTITDFTFDNTTNILTLTIDGGNTDTADLSALAGGGNPDATDVNFTSYISITSPNVQGAIQQLKDEVDGIVVAGGGNPTDELQDLQISGTVLTVTNPATVGNQVDLDLVFATDAELLASAANGSETIINPSASVTVSGTGTTGDPYILGIANLGVGSAQLADNAVTSIKITDDNVTLAKLANGTAAGQLMQWNGTDWVLVADTALNLTEADGIIGNEVTNTTNATLLRSGTGTAADPYTLGIADLGVGAAQLADNAVTSIKITDGNVTLAKLANGTAAGQLMQWNGTDWVLVADTALSLTETDG